MVVHLKIILPIWALPHDFYSQLTWEFSFVYVVQLKGTVAKYNLAHNADIVKIRFYEIFRPKQCFHKIKMHLRNVYPLFEIQQQQELKMHFLGFFSVEKSGTNPFIRELVQKSDKS